MNKMVATRYFQVLVCSSKYRYENIYKSSLLTKQEKDDIIFSTP